VALEFAAESKLFTHVGLTVKNVVPSIARQRRLGPVFWGSRFFRHKYKQLAVLLVYPGLFIGAVWNTAGVGMVIFRISQPAAVEQLKCPRQVNFKRNAKARQLLTSLWCVVLLGMLVLLDVQSN
jgi:hypothetical protein